MVGNWLCNGQFSIYKKRRYWKSARINDGTIDTKIVYMIIKAENGNLIILIPLKDESDIKSKTIIGDELKILMQWISDNESIVHRPLTEEECNTLIKWLFNRNG